MPWTLKKFPVLFCFFSLYQVFRYSQDPIQTTETKLGNGTNKTLLSTADNNINIHIINLSSIDNNFVNICKLRVLNQ